MFESKIMFTLDVLDLIDSAISSTPTTHTQRPSTDALNELSLEYFDNFDGYFD